MLSASLSTNDNNADLVMCNIHQLRLIIVIHNNNQETHHSDIAILYISRFTELQSVVDLAISIVGMCWR